MILNDFITALVNQELKNLAPVEFEKPNETDNLYGRFNLDKAHLIGIIASINSGLLSMHTRFELLIKEIIIITHPSITNYELTKDRAKTDPGRVLVKYIDDNNAEPYDEDILKIKNVITEDGIDLPINNKSYADSVFISSYNSIVFPNNNGRRYSVLYQAKHKDIVYPAKFGTASLEGEMTTVDMNQKINIHKSLLEPLRLFVASKVLDSMNDPVHVAKSFQLLNTYNLLLNDLKISGIVSTDMDSDDEKVFQKGFAPYRRN